MASADSQAAGIHAWWMCSDEASRRQAVDALSAAAWQAGERVAVIRSPEAILNHVSVLENILLPAAWHRPEVRSLRPQVMEWLNEQFGAQTARLLLERRGDQLRTADREQLGVARALQLEATTLLIEDDDRSRDEWLRESVELLERLMPAVPLDVVSTRPPSPFRSWVLMPSPPQQGRA